MCEEEKPPEDAIAADDAGCFQGVPEARSVLVYIYNACKEELDRGGCMCDCRHCGGMRDKENGEGL
jgi:hypothetical protein